MLLLGIEPRILALHCVCAGFPELSYSERVQIRVPRVTPAPQQQLSKEKFTCNIRHN